MLALLFYIIIEVYQSKQPAGARL